MTKPSRKHNVGTWLGVVLTGLVGLSLLEPALRFKPWQKAVTAIENFGKQSWPK